MNICTSTSALVGVHEIVEFHILRVGTGKIENIVIFKTLEHSHFSWNAGIQQTIMTTIDA